MSGLLNSFQFGRLETLWTTTYDDSVTLAPPSDSFTQAGPNTSSYGTFSGLLPATGQYYFDVVLLSGFDTSPSHVGFFGLSNVVGTFDYNVSASYKAWYWSGAWYGDAGVIADNPSTLVSGTYRIAVDRGAGRFYMQRISGTPSAIRAAGVPGANLYLMMLPQSGFQIPSCTISNGGLILPGNGGLY
jgi:hypothetical protein